MRGYHDILKQKYHLQDKQLHEHELIIAVLWDNIKVESTQLVCTYLSIVTSNCVFLFVTENEHENHETNPKRGLASNVKSFVQEKYAKGITKRNHMLERICRKNLAVPLKCKLTSFLQSSRVQKLSAATFVLKNFDLGVRRIMKCRPMKTRFL